MNFYTQRWSLRGHSRWSYLCINTSVKDFVDFFTVNFYTQTSVVKRALRGATHTWIILGYQNQCKISHNVWMIRLLAWNALWDEYMAVQNFTLEIQFKSVFSIAALVYGSWTIATFCNQLVQHFIFKKVKKFTYCWFLPAFNVKITVSNCSAKRAN